MNDIYYSLIPLYYPPSLLAYTALYMSSVYDQKNITFIFGANDIDMNDIYEASSKIISFYKSFPSLGMTEPDAHAYIEKQAMNRRMTRREIANDILQSY